MSIPKPPGGKHLADNKTASTEAVKPPGLMPALTGVLHPQPTSSIGETSTFIRIKKGDDFEVIFPPILEKVALPDGTLFLGFGEGTGKHSLQADAAFYQISPNGNVMFAVADGVGSHTEASDASKRVLQELMNENARGGFDGVASGIETVKAVDVVLRKLHVELSLTPLARTTVAGVLERPEALYVFSIGNSRVYGFRNNGVVEPLTKDDGLAQKMVDGGSQQTDDSLVNEFVLRDAGAALGSKEFKVGAVVMLPKEGFRAIMALTDGITDEFRQKSTFERMHPFTPLNKAFTSDNPAEALFRMIYNNPINPHEMDNACVVVRRFNPKK